MNLHVTPHIAFDNGFSCLTNVTTNVLLTTKEIGDQETGTFEQKEAGKFSLCLP